MSENNNFSTSLNIIFESFNEPFDINYKAAAVDKVKFVRLERDVLNAEGNDDGLNKLAEKTILDRDNNIFCPVIYFGDFDMANANFNKEPYSDFDKRFRFLDSSIWTRYVQFSKAGEQLPNLLKEIEKNYEINLYKTNVAREFIEYNIRLFQNAYLAEMGGHASSVAPTIFHSESTMKNRADKLLRDKIKNHQLRWDVLLIDDYANCSLRVGEEEESDKNRTPSKKEIIDDIVNKEEEVFNISFKETIEAAEQEIKELNKNKRAFDIILLDFLFSKDRDGDEGYGTELIDRIHSNEITEGKSFNYKYWIFPVSVFSNAFHSSIREKSIQPLEKNWVIPRGADPINTPHLFRQNLYEFAYIQYENASFTKEALVKLWLDFPIEEKGNSIVDAREWANNFSHVLWNNYGKSESMHYGSSFTEAVLKKRIEEKSTTASAYQAFLLLNSITKELGFKSIFDMDSALNTYQRILDILDPKSISLKPEEETAFEKQLNLLGEGVYAIKTNY